MDCQLLLCKTALRDYSIDNYNSLISKNFNDLSKKINFLMILKKKYLDKYNKNSIQHAKKFDPSLITKKWLKMIESL